MIIKRWDNGQVIGELEDIKKGKIKNLDRASLDGASLYGASLDGASLYGASLIEASLNGASLNRASLNRASLNGASLDGASLIGASLENINWGIPCYQSTMLFALIAKNINLPADILYALTYESVCWDRGQELFKSSSKKFQSELKKKWLELYKKLIE